MNNYSDLLKLDQERRRDDARTFRRIAWLTRAGVIVAAFGLLVFSLSSCSITMPVAATGPVNTAKEKEGRASATVVLGLCFGGDASTAKAAKAGGIVNVHTVDLHTYDVLRIYRKHTTIVRGE